MYSPNFQIVQVSDLINRSLSYKVFRRGKAGREPPLFASLPTRAEAEHKVRELEEEMQAKARALSESRQEAR